MKPQITVFLLVTLLAATIAEEDQCPTKRNKFQILVIDAGSTGTILYLYGFYNYKNQYIVKSTQLSLANHKSLGKGKALSSYNEQTLPYLRDDIDELIVKAKHDPDIDPLCHTEIPIYCLATAGLRAVDPTLAQKILNIVKEEIDKMNFKKVDNNSRILSGREEGVDLWLSANTAYMELDTGIPKQNFILLDLGGGSTQVTLAAKGDKVNRYRWKSPDVEMDPGSTGGVPYKVYSHSYPFGLMEIRKSFIEWTPKPATSECIHPDTSVEFKFGDITEQIQGKRGTEDRYTHCDKIAFKTVKPVKDVWSRWEQYLPKIQGVSAFYYTVSTTVRHIFGCKEGSEEPACTATCYQSTPYKIKRSAEILCADPPKTGSPFKDFLCIDLLYLYRLLTEGYGFPEHQKIKFSNSAKDVNLGWPLGFAIEEAHDYFQHLRDEIIS